MNGVYVEITHTRRHLLSTCTLYTYVYFKVLVLANLKYDGLEVDVFVN